MWALHSLLIVNPPALKNQSTFTHSLPPLQFPHVMPTHSQVRFTCGINVGPERTHSAWMQPRRSVLLGNSRMRRASRIGWICCPPPPTPIHWRLPTRIVTFLRKKIDPWAHKTLFSFHSFHYNTNFVFGLLYLPRISSRCFWKQVFLFVCVGGFFLQKISTLSC